MSPLQHSVKNALLLTAGIIGLVLLCLGIPALAQRTNELNTANSQAPILVSFGCEGTACAGLVIDATAGGITLTSSIYNPAVTDQPAGFSRAQRADCYNLGAKIWVSDLPAALLTLASAHGRGIPDQTSFSIYGYTNISNFRAIRDSSTSSQLYCDYYRQ